MPKQITKTGRWLAWLVVVLALGCALSVAAEQDVPASSQSEVNEKARIDQLIDKLVSEEPTEREAAIEELNTFDFTVYEKLSEASRDETRPERAAAAQQVAEAMNDVDLRITDSLGYAISGASVTVLPSDGSEPVTTQTNPVGGIKYGPADRATQRYPVVRVRVEHPKYGIAEQGVSKRQWQLRPLKTALLPDGHERMDQAVEGLVVDAQGQPVSGALNSLAAQSLTDTIQ